MVKPVSQWTLDPVSGVERIEILRIDDLLENLVHEYGHSVKEHALRQEQDIEWHELHRTTEEQDFLSARAKKSADEDFAVCYIWYILRPEELREKDLKRFDFMQRNLGI
jgi:hypothetical protein